MIRFRPFEKDGLAIAAMSDRSDGGCGFDDNPINRRAYLRQLGLDPNHLICARQVHGTDVATVTDDDRGRGSIERESALPNTDAIVTNTQGLPIGIHVADCTPIWLYDPETRTAGLVHAGWRGTQADIAGATVRTMVERFGARRESMRALIGPCAGSEAYEVSSDIANQFRESRGRCLDLPAANRAWLLDAGLKSSNIASANLCTITGGRFYSYRRGDTLPRNLAIMAISPT